MLELGPAVRAGDWGLLSEKPELELEGRENENEVTMDDYETRQRVNIKTSVSFFLFMM